MQFEAIDRCYDWNRPFLWAKNGKNGKNGKNVRKNRDVFGLDHDDADNDDNDDDREVNYNKYRNQGDIYRV